MFKTGNGCPSKKNHTFSITISRFIYFQVEGDRYIILFLCWCLCL